MSIKVMSQVWAASTHKGSALLLLLAIADHAHDDGGGAYPSIETLAAKIRMGKRNVIYLLKTLEKSGELAVNRDSGPNGANLYQISMVQSLHVQNPTQHGAIPCPHGAIPCNGLVQNPASLSAIAIAPKPSLEPLKEPLLEPSVNKRVQTSQELDIKIERLPQGMHPWLDVLREIPAWSMKEEMKLLAWVEKKCLGADHLERTALALKAKWPGKYRDPVATFKNWVLMPERSTNGKSQDALPAAAPKKSSWETNWPNQRELYAKQEAERDAANRAASVPSVSGSTVPTP